MFSEFLYKLPAIIMLLYVYNFPLRRPVWVSFMFQFLASIISYLSTILIMRLINMRYYTLGNSLQVNIAMIIFYYVYKYIDYIWFVMCEIVILFVEAMLWHDISNEECVICGDTHVLVRKREDKEIKISTCGTCSYLLCPKCYIKYYMTNKNCPLCKQEKEKFDITNITEGEYLEMAFKTIGFLIVMFT